MRDFHRPGRSSVFAAKVMATTTLDLLTRPEVLEAVQTEWEQRMEGRTYTSPLPPDLEPPLDQLESSKH